MHSRDKQSERRDEDMGRLDGKVALITGAGSGIGRATAKAMAAEGAAVAIAEINAAAGDQVAQEVTAAGGRCIAIATDVTDEDSVKAAVDRVVQHFGGLHVLHNNAGGSSPRDGSVLDVDLDEFWRVIRLDLFGTFLGCRFGIPAIIASGGGSVINMTSSTALKGSPGIHCYVAAKGGIVALTRTMAVEFGPKKVRVNAIAPHTTLTDRVRSRIPAEVMAAPEKTHLLGMMEPEDVAAMAVFLASDESSKVTGHVMPVDSGYTIS
jgi:NAD(P)-dependent dehydrogenase (short-subunit alcohol dehydrogenase family)